MRPPGASAWVNCSTLFHFFGDSEKDPLGLLPTGPVGGGGLLIGLLLFLKYPLRK